VSDAVPEFLAERYSRAELIRALLQTYPEQARTKAVLDVAAAAGVAVAWEDRDSIEAKLNVRFTDDEWARVADQLDGFDEWLGNSGAGDSLHYWVSEFLPRAAGLDLEAIEERTAAEEVGDPCPS
jgi:hypothetical protein